MRILLAVALLLVLAACGDGASPAATATGARPASSPTAAPGGSPQGALPAPVRAAIAAAARDEGVAESAVQLVEWSEEEWESSALGCPRPDMTYLPVITPGYAVQLVVDGRRLEYHTNLESIVVRCPSPPQP